ncbi:MAG TPA: hypothetical protein VHE78_19900 [Gemmatimonadaceae bacterium]|nr:hypothetical protein [Gemmatimonadaceae bacterium]
MRRRLTITLLAAGLALGAPALRAQAPRADTAGQQAERLRAFLDCQTMGCDRDFFVTEIAFVNWTRDRADADIHVLVTALTTASGGLQYTVQFIGQRRFASHADTLLTGVTPNSTNDEQRRALARTIKQVLVRYAAATAAAAHLDVTYDAPAATSASPTARDPWNLWVYRLGSHGFFNGESRTKSASLSGNLSASRTTDRWKLSLGADLNYRQSNYTFSDSSSSVFIQRSSSANFRLVRSLTSHWSAGLNANVGHAEFNNQDLSMGVRASIEYNFYPWKQATQHQFVAIYAIGPSHNRYIAETIYLKTAETLAQHQFILANTTTERWGSVDLTASVSQYLHDRSKANASLGGSVNINLAKGLSVNIGGSASSVHDQLFLERGTLSVQDILTRQRALATSFSYFSFLGLSYTFGSIYNTIVNPRLDKLTGGGQSFFFSM